MYGKFAISFILFPQILNAAQNAVVVTDGAMIYRKGNFDSRVIGYLRKGKKVKVSSKTYGPFYRVRFRQGVIGYISDVDVVPANKVKGKFSGKTTKKRKKRVDRSRPAFHTFQLGFALGYTQYTEVISRSEKNASILTYGLKMSVPFTLFDGPFVLDTSAHLTGDPPSYYDDISEKEPKGFVGILDIQLMFLLDDFANHNGSIYLGAGPMVAYSAVEIEESGSSFVSEEARAGGVFTIGLGYKMGPVSLKIEPRYYVEKANYFSILSGLQFSF